MLPENIYNNNRQLIRQQKDAIISVTGEIKITELFNQRMYIYEDIGTDHLSHVIFSFKIR